jgi:pimeloyl-ACP methyl ester carboxylesterase
LRRVVRIFGAVVGIVLVLVLVVPLVVPLPTLEGTRPPEMLAYPDSEFVDLRGVRVHYQRAGEGEPVFLLLHGFLASTFSWREIIGPLSEIGSVIAFDRPAFGLTSRPTPEGWGDDNPYTSEFALALTLDLLDALGVERAVLVGNSAGGTLAIRIALEHPERVEALVLVDAAVYGDGGSRSFVRPLLRTPQLRRIGPVILRDVREWGVEFGRSAWHDPTKMTPDVWEGYTLPLQADNWDRALYEYTIAGEQMDLVPSLGHLDLPVLVITGDDDRIVPTEDSIRLASEIPGAGLVVVSDCGHVPHEECPEAFLAAVVDFVEELP